MRRPTRFTAVLILASIVVGNLFFLRPATAQDLVATEDLVGGSSVFVFREGRKKPQRHAGVGRVRARRDDARATRVSSQAAASARRRRLAEIARRKQLARSTGRKAAISNSLTAKAEQFLDADKIDLAITNFRAALAEDAKNVRASQGLSVALTAKGIETAGETNNAAAAPLFEEAVRLDPQNDAAFAKLGAIYDAEGRQADAITNYERAIAINPDYALIYPSLGIAYIQQGEIAKGQAALSNAERAGINDADVEFLRGLIAFRNDRDDAAAAAFERSEEHTSELQSH